MKVSGKWIGLFLLVAAAIGTRIYMMWHAHIAHEPATAPSSAHHHNLAILHGHHVKQQAARKVSPFKEDYEAGYEVPVERKSSPFKQDLEEDHDHHGPGEEYHEDAHDEEHHGDDGDDVELAHERAHVRAGREHEAHEPAHEPGHPVHGHGSPDHGHTHDNDEHFVAEDEGEREDEHDDHFHHEDEHPEDEHHEDEHHEEEHHEESHHDQVQVPSGGGSGTRKSMQKTLINSLKGKLKIGKEKQLPAKLEVDRIAGGDPVPPRKPQWAPGKAGKVSHGGWIINNKGGSAYSHMATIAPMPPGSAWKWMVAWQTAAKIEGTDGMHIRAAFSDDAKSWSAAVEVPLGRGIQAVWSPVLFYYPKEGSLLLFYSESLNCKKHASGHNPPRWAPGGDIRLVRSWDGITWTAPVTIYNQGADGGIPKVIANPPHLTAKGDLVLPFWRERPMRQACRTDMGVTAGAGVLISKDGGHKWHAHGNQRGPGTWLIEGAVSEVANNKLFQVFRTKNRHIYGATSDDGGRSWSTAKSIGVPNPDAKIAMVRLEHTKELALAFNDSPSSRSKLKVALSEGGKQWSRIADIENGQAGLNFGYPTLVQDNDRLIVVYSVMRRGGKVPVTRSGVKVAIVQLPDPEKFTKGYKPPVAVASNATIAESLQPVVNQIVELNERIRMGGGVDALSD